MKTRIIDRFSVPNMRKPSDDVWLIFANHLITAFGDPLIQNGTDPEVLERLYCSQRVRDQDESTLDSIVYTVPPAYVRFNRNDIKSGCDDKLHWADSPTSPFLLLGHVGTGKTLFLDYTFLHRLVKNDDSIKAIIIDFLKAEDIEGEFRHFMLKSINSSLNSIDPLFEVINSDLLEKLFSAEVASIKSSLRSKKAQEEKIDGLFSDYVTCHLPGNEDSFKELIRRKIEYLSGKYNIWIILDNIDQHHSCLHNTAFVTAVAMASGFEANLIIAMRYISLATPAARGAYNSYRPRKLKLSSPDVGEILERRIAYFMELADDILHLDLKWTGYRENVSELVIDIENTISLLSESTFLNTFVLPLANYNLRRLLEIILSIFQSYFFFYDRFNNERYLPSIRTLKKRFIYAHLLKNEDYYGLERDEKESFIINMFENENNTFCCNQTIRIRLLQALMTIGRSATLAEITNIILSTFGYSHYDLCNAYRAFMKAELFAIKGDLNLTHDTSVIHEGITEEHMFSDATTIALTYAGTLHYDLLSQLEYIEIMKLSTYVPSDMCHEIQSEDNQKTISDRAASTRKFLKYLAQEERDEFSDRVLDKEKYNLNFGAVVPTMIKEVVRSLREIEKQHRSSKY